jgi:hypothetical protein
MQQRLGTNPPLSDQSLGAYMMRLRDPKTGQPLPDERLLPHIGMICKLPVSSLCVAPNPADAVNLSKTHAVCTNCSCPTDEESCTSCTDDTTLDFSR